MIQKEMQRTDSFDILKGIGIILMIIAHTFGPNSILWDYIYAFHMPLFFIVSGYFYKTKPFFELSKKNINKLLIPYIVLCIIVIILNQIRQTHEITDDIKVALNGIGPGWFLLAMFMARFEFYFILKIYSKNYLLVSIITSTAVCLFCYYYNMPRFSTLLSFFPSLASLVFIATGYFIRQHNLLSINKGVFHLLF